MSEWSSYYREMVEYYDGAKYAFDWRAVKQAYTEAETKMGAERRATMEWLQEAFAGRRVLELACGGGAWTRHIARTASSVLATDTCGEMLRIGRELTPAANVEFGLRDAFDLAGLPRRFDAAFHFNFINHVAYEDWPRLLGGLHAVLEPGAVVVMGGQPYRGDQQDGRGNNYDWRACDSGQRYRLIDNWPDEGRVRAAVGDQAEELEYHEKQGWMARYRVA